MNIVFFGTSRFGLPTLEALKSSHSLMAVLSTPDRPAGRRRKLQASPVKEWAAQHGLRVFDYLKDDLSACLAAIRKIPADLFVVASFGAILPGDFLMLPKRMALNIHASLLPKYRGASPMQAALLNGDSESGVSVIRMIERLDAGDVLLQKKTDISPTEDIMELEKKLSRLGAEAILEALGQIELGTAKFTVQNETQVSYTKKISKNDGRIDWSLPANVLHNRVRAFLGWPGAHFFCRGKRVLVSRCELLPLKNDAKPGTVLDTDAGAGLSVAAGSKTTIRLTELQLEGKKNLPWAEFCKGFALKKAEILE